MIRWFKAMRLNTRIHAVTVAPLLVVYIALGCSIWSTLNTLADQQLEIKGEQLITSASSLLQSALISGDKEAAKLLLGSIADNPDVVSVTLIRGKTRENFAVAQGKARPDSELKTVLGVVSRESFNESLWSGSTSTAYDAALGRIEVALSRARTESVIHDVMGKIAIVAALVLVAAMFLGRVIGLSISRPLRAMSNDVTRITRGDYSAQLNLNRDDEIGILAGNIDTMANELDLQRRSIDENVQELLNSREEAERSNEHKGALLGAISREFSQPLIAGIANLQQALALDGGAESVDYTHRALEHIEYLSELNLDVELLAQSDNGAEVMRSAPFELSHVISSLVDSYKGKLSEREIYLHVDWGANKQLAHQVIHSDPIRLRVLLNNMIEYAVNSFRDSGDIVIRLFLRNTADVMEIMIDMINNGVSVSVEDVNTIARLLDDDSNEIFKDDVAAGHLPIELRTAQRIARSLHGSFSLHSNFSRSTVLSVRLTAACIANNKACTAAIATACQSIMIVEDSCSAPNIAISYLRSKGITVDEFHRGSDALNAARRSGYSMIFIDNDAEDLDALTVAHKIRALPNHQRTILIALVNKREASVAEQLLQNGFSETLRKPVTGNQLYKITEGSAKLNEHIQSLTH